MPEPAKILVVEDEADVRKLLLAVLGRGGHLAEGVADGEEALRIAPSGAHDLVILDWMLPGRPGLELCPRLAVHAPVLMVTARARPDDVVAGLRAGAEDYVTKPFDIPVLLERVRKILERRAAGRGNAPAVLRLGEIVLDVDAHRASCGGRPLALTRSEFALVRALAEGHGRALSRSELIDRVQGPGVHVSHRSIDTHLACLRKKLGPAAGSIETVRGVGYRARG